MSEDYRSAVSGIAAAIAPGWERRRAFLEAAAAPVREWLIRELVPRPGQTLLELAAGAGDTGFEAARLIGQAGRLISTDFSPAMLDVARRRGREVGAGNVDYRVMDVERIELETGSVDGVLCRFGYMLMADPAVALAETRRVLRPGGRVALAVWGPPERNPYFALIGMLLVQHGHLPPPNPAEPGIFSMASAERARALLEEAGFTDVRTEQVPVRFAVTSVEEYLSIIADTAGPIAIVLRKLSDGARKHLATQLDSGFAAFATGSGYELPGVVLAAAASRGPSARTPPR